MTERTDLWSREVTERMLALALASLSASAVAARLNAELGTRLSRNSVLGKLARLRAQGHPAALALREAAARPRRPRGRAPKRASPGAARAARAPAPPPPAPVSAIRYSPPPAPPAPAQEPPASGLALPRWPAPGRCLWPHGDVRRGDLRWCAAPVEGPRSRLTRCYCAYHAAIATQRKGDAHAA